MAAQTVATITPRPYIEAVRLFELPPIPIRSVAEVSILVTDTETWRGDPAHLRPEWSATEVDGVVVAVRMLT